jgi:hypothetical protein
MSHKPRRPRRDHYLPMLVPILDAFDVLGIGITKGYELVKAGRIETIHIGRRRYATRESLERLATPMVTPKPDRRREPRRAGDSRDAV